MDLSLPPSLLPSHSPGYNALFSMVIAIWHKPGSWLGRSVLRFLFNLTDRSLPAPLLQHRHFCNDRVGESGNSPSSEQVQAKKLTSGDTTDLFQGAGDWKETQEADVAGLQDPAALLWARQGICKRTLSELEMDSE